MVDEVERSGMQEPEPEEAVKAEAPEGAVTPKRALDPSSPDWREAIDAYVEEVWPQVLEDIADLVAVPSVEDLARAKPGLPYGPGPRRATDVALGIAERLGLRAHDDDGYVAWADVTGASERILATMCHCDIVPVEGQDWESDPFEMVRRDGYLLGRGVADDKGPLALTLWAAHFFQRLVARGVELPYTLRAIIGSNEETGMRDAEMYIAHEGSPAFLFTPDADFPVCYGEKGIYHGLFTSERIAGGKLVEMDGGTVANAVPSKAMAVVAADADTLPAAEDIAVCDLGDGRCRIVAHGIDGHASRPEGTKNAIKALNGYLLDHGLYDEVQRPFLELQAKLLADDYGEAIGIAATDALFGASTVVGGVVRTVDGRFTQTVDSRYVTSITGERIAETLRAEAEEHGCTFETTHDDVPFYVKPDSPEIETLMAVYREHTGRDAEPYTIGGGTYARHFDRAVGFGPEEFDDPKPEWVGDMHGANEGIAEAQLKTSLGIYIDAIARLMMLEL